MISWKQRRKWSSEKMATSVSTTQRLSRELSAQFGKVELWERGGQEAAYRERAERVKRR